MSNTMRSGIATTRIDRRTVLHHSAGGLAIPALGAAGRPGAGGAAYGVADDLVGQLKLAHGGRMCTCRVCWESNCFPVPAPSQLSGAPIRTSARVREE
jgi:hypothetical protein